jgi:hypothetical protein
VSDVLIERRGPQDDYTIRFPITNGIAGYVARSGET